MERLRSSRAIRTVLDEGASRRGRLLSVHVRRRDDREAPSRVAVIASRHVGGAVVRNRAKRLLREAARHTAPAAGDDLVLIARRGCAEADMPTVRAELQRLLQQIQPEEQPT